jgi:signal transduction histidine kinase
MEMSLARLKLRQKLLVLLFIAGGIGLVAFALVQVITDHQLSVKFIPENRSLRDVQSRAALLIHDYYRFMLSPDIITVSQLDGELVLIRQSLASYTQLIAGQPIKEQLAESIGNSINGLEQAGREMIAASRSFIEIFAQQEQLEEDIDRVFEQYQSAVSIDIGNSIENQDWGNLTGDYLPELRMIDSIKQQFLMLFLNIRKFQIDPSGNTIAEIGVLQQRIAGSSTLFEIYVAKSNVRAELSAQILAIYKRMLAVVDTFTLSRQRAEFAVSRAEQSGIDLNESIMSAITASDTVGWKNLRESLVLLSGILLMTLVISYLLIYIGLDRILGPLEKLQTVISRLGKGDFKQRSKDVDGIDEIGQLAVAFNRMADQLEENAGQKQLFIDQLEQKNMELERFTYTVSHELKSPLVTVNGFLGLLARDLGDATTDAVQNDMQQITSAMDTMGRQLEDLLELSRVGRVVNPPQAFALTDVCREVLDTLHGPINEAAAQIKIGDRMPDVYADQVRVREVIQNLVENAIKFSSTMGQPRVDISAEVVADKVLCRVCDNGPGIDPQYHDKVFELFDRLDSEIPGTGIGLALVKRIIEIHEGNIWIESQEDGQGCCFCFTLPFQRGTGI